MSDDMIVAVFATSADADAAIRELEEAAIPGLAVGRHLRLDTVPGYNVSVTDHTDEASSSSFWSRFFSAESKADDLAGSEPDSGGGTIVTVHTADEHADAVIDIFERHELIDVDRHGADPKAFGITRRDVIDGNPINRV